MNAKAKKVLLTGLTVALLNAPFLMNSEFATAKELPRYTASAKAKNELSTKQVVQLANIYATASSYVQRGGDYKKGEYKTFTYKGKTYRYLAANIDTKKELLNYLQQSLTKSAAEQFIKTHGIIEYKGKLAQIEADGGSLLQWGKATASYIKAYKNTLYYRLTVPVGETGVNDSYLVEYQYVEKVGWRISKEPTFEQSSLTDKLAVELAANYAKASSFVQAGGSYREGEYKTFTYNGKTYRYLSSQIDTKNELLSYLKNTLTQNAAEEFIKSRGIIEYNGRLAQVEADGGSLLKWDKAATQLLKADKSMMVYLLSVPVGDTSEKQDYVIEYQYVQKVGWRMSKEPYWNLDIPGNINPAFNFVTLLLKNTEATKQLFLYPASFNVDEFKKGIKKMEYVDLKEIGRSKSQVEYIVKVNVELDSNYKGTLVNGENKLYFVIQPVGYMDFKIAEIGRIALY